ncbi:homoserine dehydrogenase NAD-binding protein [Methanothermococcus okinawensis IH1]|uniref:Homoserine dehydrogenase NAD-binding protein n=1 Tax=Methanothermococcus okinawensis (strain DSM 14208 / JCM 11175 / IH1) TaxID=647113 RepID=F8AMV0_METOI|nr:homoserine dehydrogenase NAD-binding protein [Methanothermococcus okinawensis IH1]
MLKIGVVGCGTIATLITKAVISGKINPKIVALYDKNRHKSEELKKLIDAEICDSVDELVSKDLDLIIECASVNAVEETVSKALNNGKDAIVMSVGAFADKNLFLKLYNLAKEKIKKYIFHQVLLQELMPLKPHP